MANPSYRKRNPINKHHHLSQLLPLEIRHRAIIRWVTHWKENVGTFSGGAVEDVTEETHGFWCVGEGRKVHGVGACACERTIIERLSASSGVNDRAEGLEESLFFHRCQLLGLTLPS